MTLTNQPLQKDVKHCCKCTRFSRAPHNAVLYHWHPPCSQQDDSRQASPAEEITLSRHPQPAFSYLLRFPQGFGGHPGFAGQFVADVAVFQRVFGVFAGDVLAPAAGFFHHGDDAPTSEDF